MPSRSDDRRRPGRPAKPISKEELLAIARRVFARDGFDAASLTAVADGAGLRKASLYHHFPSKKAMYLAVLNNMAEELQVFIHEASNPSSDMAEQLDRLGERMVKYFGQHPDAAKLLVHEMLGQGPWLENGGRKVIQDTLELTTSFLKKGMEQGVFREQDPKQLALSIVSVHLLYFATGPIIDDFIATDSCAPEMLKQRQLAVVEQVRSLCLDR